MTELAQNLNKPDPKIVRFLQEHKKWSRWLGVDQESIHTNTIWHQCIDMVNNHFCYIGLNEAGYLTSKSSTSKDFFSINKPLADFIQQSYLNYQCLAIRKLTDVRDDIHSLTRLISKLEKNSHLMNREVFVCFLGYPYEYEKGLEIHNKNVRKMLMESEDNTAWTPIPLERHSKERHQRFDMLSNTESSKRKKSDTVDSSYWSRLKEKLDIPEIKQIRSFTGKYLAHAADERSAAELEKEAETFTIGKIELCHKAILEVFHSLARDFWFTTLMVEPSSAHNIGYKMDMPFTSPEIKDLIHKYIENKSSEYLSVQGITINRPA